jgi:hypothetical protein
MNATARFHLWLRTFARAPTFIVILNGLAAPLGIEQAIARVKDDLRRRHRQIVATS